MQIMRNGILLAAAAAGRCCRWPLARRHSRLHHQPAPGGGTNYTLPVQTLLLMTALTFIPAALLMMTSFTRIIIVLSLLRQALGTQTAPPNQVMVGLALFLTLFVMGPTFDKIYTEAYLPLQENRIQMGEAMDKARRR
jgi:flagellar biosynthetic protein FliP